MGPLIALRLEEIQAIADALAQGGGDDDNEEPTAAFTSDCTNLACSFTDESSDSDGSIASRAWNFGDGDTSTSTNPSHIFAVADTYTVSLTVTDNQGGTDSTSQNVTVSGGPLVVFYDSFEFEGPPWNDLWTEDPQDDWFISTQRAKEGDQSAEVDGSATDAQLISVPIDLQGRTEATITFNWLIEKKLNKREYLAFDVSTDGGSSWAEHALLRGGVDEEEATWHPVQVDLDLSELSSPIIIRIRFRATISGARKDANVDEVRVIAGSGGGTAEQRPDDHDDHNDD
jgi:PKD repeat protein